MGIKVRDSGNVLRTITQIRARDAGNVLRTIQRVRIRDAGNVLRTVWTASPPLSASISGGPASGSILGAGPVTTGSITCSPTGGTAPYSYAWTFVSGNSFTVDSPTSATTAFSTTLSTAETKTATYRCTITDANGEAAFADETVTAEELS